MPYTQEIDVETTKRRKDVLKRDSLVAKIRDYFISTFGEHKSPKTPFSIVDCLMSGLGIFLFKYPSLLRFEGAYNAPQACENLKGLLKVNHLPSDTSLRIKLDEIDPDSIRPIFKALFNELRRNADINDYRRCDGSYLLSIDGTQTFSSKKVHCKSCLSKKHRNGTTSYSHQMMTAVLISPTNKAVFPIDWEEISNTDGSTKNDCELNAGHRLLRRIRENYPNTKFTITADSLSSNSPNIELLKELRFNFILVAKDGNHKHLVKQQLDQMGKDELEVYDYVDENSTRHVAIPQNSVELNASNNTKVNYLCYWTESSDGQQTYYNTWVSNMPLTESNVFEIARSGRTYWRIENETHNTLKNQGYNFEHNYGHGEKHLCSVFSVLTLLAFLIDQVNLACPKLAFLVSKIKSKVGAWEQLLMTLFTTRVFSFSDLYNKTLKRFAYNTS